jgi:hypothetical protein
MRHMHNAPFCQQQVHRQQCCLTLEEECPRGLRERRPPVALSEALPTNQRARIAPKVKGEAQNESRDTQACRSKVFRKKYVFE